MNRQNFKKSLLFSLVLISLSGFFVSGEIINKARAAIGLSVTPVKVSHTLKPNQTASGKILITNVSDQPVLVEPSVEDFMPLEGTYTIRYVGRAEGVTTVRDWIKFEPSKPFVLKEKESKEVIYTIDAPAKAEPGGHFGILFFKADKIAEGEGEQLKIGTRVGVLVFITVPGSHLQKGKILDFKAPLFVQKGPVDFTINFENTGTVHFEPKGVITIKNILGKKAGEVPVSGQVVLPTGVRDLSARWEAGFLLGRYRAALEIKDGEGNVLTAKSVSFYAFPIWYILGFAGGVLAVFYGLKLFRRKFSFKIKIAKK